MFLAGESNFALGTRFSLPKHPATEAEISHVAQLHSNSDIKSTGDISLQEHQTVHLPEGPYYR